MHLGAVVVTGSSSGLGAAICDYLIARNRPVIGVDRRGTSEQTQGLQPYEMDVTDDKAVKEFADWAAKRPISGLVNCAGVMDDYRSVEETSMELFDQLLDVNLRAAFQMIKVLLPVLHHHASARIVNIASTASILGNNGGVAYTTSKHGLVGLSRSVASSYGSDRLTCNAVLPGSIATDLQANSAEYLGREPTDYRRRGYSWLSREELKKRIPVGRRGTSTEVASLVGFLLSPDSAYVNGACLVVDGGLSIGADLWRNE